MISVRSMAVFAAVLLALSLWLRPVIGRLGKPPQGNLSVSTSAEKLADPPPSTAVVPSEPIEHLRAVAAAIFEATNRERRKERLPVLAEEPQLAEIATAHSDNMLVRHFFDHVDPDGVAPADRVARGHRTLVGTSAENIWMGSGFPTDDAVALGNEIVESWMGSRGHRENILRRELTHLGVGVSLAGDEIRATQLFGGVWGYLSTPLPKTLARGGALKLAFEPYNGRPAAERIDLFAEGRPRWGPRGIETPNLEAPNGRYLMRFYFPREGGYTISYGPEVEIAP